MQMIKRDIRQLEVDAHLGAVQFVRVRSIKQRLVDIEARDADVR